MTAYKYAWAAVALLLAAMGLASLGVILAWAGVL